MKRLEVTLCRRCSPLLKDPKLDTLGRLTAKLCGACRLKVALVKVRRRVEQQGPSTIDDEMKRAARKLEKLKF